MNIKLVMVLLLMATGLQAQSQTTGTTLAGTWELVSVINNYPDGKKVYPYGESPKGILMFDDHGHYSIQIYKAGRANVISGDKNKCTPEEYATLVQGSNSHFGNYVLDESAKTITFDIRYASFPNWEGTQQKRSYELKDGLIRYVVTQTTQGGSSVVAEVSWRRL